YDAPLDMRMDPALEVSAREIVAEWDERRLAQVLREYGEERHAAAIAREIVRRRERAPIATTLELVDAIGAAVPAPARFAGGHPGRRSGASGRRAEARGGGTPVSARAAALAPAPASRRARPVRARAAGVAAPARTFVERPRRPIAPARPRRVSGPARGGSART